MPGASQETHLPPHSRSGAARAPVVSYTAGLHAVRPRLVDRPVGPFGRPGSPIAGVGYCNVTRCCQDVCPEHINITDDAIIPLKERVADLYFDPLRALGRRLSARSVPRGPD